ncbi:hypothetical protein CRE_23521 [Caenorhabditis remanei]|uniref:Uncharacterized protein n=1 Tax=Caenorhabditis remanei TaxID=31234 RepID=E3MH60_CAERE|nr:hypothetical protein CRE_23521 [Caenorhabditis remanei]
MSTESSFGYVQCSSCNEKITDQFWMLSENKFCSACHSKSLGSKTTKKKLPTCANKVCRTRLKYGSKLHPKTKEEVCLSCYCYYKRKGKDREVIRVRGDYKNRLAQVFTQEEPLQDNYLEKLQSMPTTVEVIKVNHMGGGSDQKLDSIEDFEKRPSDFNADLEDVALVNLEQLEFSIEEKFDVFVSDKLRRNFITSDHLAYSQHNELSKTENAPEASPLKSNFDEFKEDRGFESFKDGDGHLSPTPEIDKDDDVSDSDSSPYSSTSLESSESSEDSTDSESDDENYTMERTLEASSTVTQDNKALSPTFCSIPSFHSILIPDTKSGSFREDVTRPVGRMNTAEDSMEVDIPVQLELKEPANNTQITHENPTQEPPKENEYKTVCYDPQSEVPIGKKIMSAIDEVAEYNESEEQAPELISSKSIPSSKRRTKSPDKEENIGISYKEKTCANTFCKQPLFSKKKYFHPVTKVKICRTCYDYYRRNERDRDVTIMRRRREKHETNCANVYCKQPLLPKRNARHPVTQERICQTCCMYYKRNGKDRGFTTLKIREREKDGKSKIIEIFFFPISFPFSCANMFCQRLCTDLTFAYKHLWLLKKLLWMTPFLNYWIVQNYIDTILNCCSIPSCHSLLPLDSTAFHLPSTGMLVCSDCYKLYLKNEYERVIAAERGAVNKKSECNLSLQEDCKSSVENLEEDSMEVESPVEQWNMPAVNTQMYHVPNLSNTTLQCSEEYNSIPPYRYQESNVVCNDNAYQIPSYQPEIYLSSRGVDFSENSAEAITYTTLEPASSSTCPLEAPITDNPVNSCQEETIAYPPEMQERETESDKNSETQEPQNKNIQEGQKCANNVCKSALFPQKGRTHPVTKEKICKPCYDYRRKSGKDRKVIVTRRKREEHETHCANAYCKKPLLPKQNALHPVTQKRVCKTCYDYHKNTGKDRKVIVTRRQREKHETHCANAYCKQPLIPKKNALHPVTQERVCQNSKTQEPQSETIHPNKTDDPYKKRPKQKFSDGEKCTNTVCQQLLLPKHFRPHPVTKEKICIHCYYHYKKYGKDREVIITHRKREKHETNCTNTICKQPLKRTYRHPVTQKIICPACLSYYQRNGRDREVIKTRRKKEQHETHCANKFCKKFLLPKRSVVHPVTKERICDNCYHYYKRNGSDREVIAEKVKKVDRDRYESGSDTMSISSDDSSIEESSESDCESDSTETDCE